jgi:hypothetical protein
MADIDVLGCRIREHALIHTQVVAVAKDIPISRMYSGKASAL